MWFRRKRQKQSSAPVEVKPVLADSDHAYEIGLIAGMTGESVEQAMVTTHWRDVIRASRDTEANSPPDASPRRAGEPPSGAHRSTQ